MAAVQHIKTAGNEDFLHEKIGLDGAKSRRNIELFGGTTAIFTEQEFNFSKMEFPFVLNYDAEKHKTKTLKGLKWLMHNYEVVTPKLAENYFNTIELAEIIQCFFDQIRDRMDEKAVVFGIPISADALDIASIVRDDEMSEIVAGIIKTLKKQSEHETQEQFA